MSACEYMFHGVSRRENGDGTVTLTLDGCEYARDLAVLAGLLAEEAPRVVPQGLDLPAIHAEIRQRHNDNLALPVLS